MYIPGMKEPTTQARAYQNTAKSYAFRSCFLSIVHKGQWLNCFDFFTGDSILPGNGRSKILDIVVVWSHNHKHTHTQSLRARCWRPTLVRTAHAKTKRITLVAGAAKSLFFWKGAMRLSSARVRLVDFCAHMRLQLSKSSQVKRAPTNARYKNLHLSSVLSSK